MTFKEMMDKLAGELPEEWEIHIELGRDSGSVCLVDPHGDERVAEGRDDIEDNAMYALEQAKADAPGFLDSEDDDDDIDIEDEDGEA